MKQQSKNNLVEAVKRIAATVALFLFLFVFAIGILVSDINLNLSFLIMGVGLFGMYIVDKYCQKYLYSEDEQEN